MELPVRLIPDRAEFARTFFTNTYIYILCKVFISYEFVVICRILPLKVRNSVVKFSTVWFASILDACNFVHCIDVKICFCGVIFTTRTNVSDKS